MPNYSVNSWLSWDKSFELEAESYEEAVQKAEEQINWEFDDDVRFGFLYPSVEVEEIEDELTLRKIEFED